MATNKSKITLADVLAVVGVILLAAAYFLGFLYRGDVLGISILKGVGLGAAFALLLWLLIKAKSARNYLRQWRIVEVVTLLLYLALAVVTSGVVIKFVSIYVEKDNLQTTALSDIEAMRHELDTFEADEKTEINRFADKLIDVVGLGSRRYDATVVSMLRDCLPGVNLRDINRRNINQNIRNFNLEKVEAFVSDNEWSERINDIERSVDTWNILAMPRQIALLRDLSVQLEQGMNQLSADIPLYSIEDTNHVYSAEAIAPKRYAITPAIGEALDQAKNLPWGIGCLVLLHLLILSAWLVTSRTNKIRPGRSRNMPSNGRLLTDKQ